jgi:hypothetical protein
MVLKQEMDRADRLEGSYLGSVALLLRERVARIKAEVSAANLQVEMMRREQAEVEKQAQDADATLVDFGRTLAAKYGLQDGDQIDFEAGQIYTQETPAAVSAGDVTPKEV